MTVTKDEVPGQGAPGPIDQSITVSDQAHTGSITVIGRLIQTTQQPSDWIPALYAVLHAHRTQIIGCMVAVGAFTSLYYLYVDRYLLSASFLLLTVCLAALLAWYVPAWKHMGAVRHSLIFVAGLCLIANLAWTGFQILRPAPFANDDFGIVLARLSEAGTLHSSPLAMTLTNQTYDTLEQMAFDHNQSAADYELPAGPGGEPDAAYAWQIALATAGVLTSPEEAAQAGKTRNADLVVWGDVATSGTNQEYVTIRFFVAEPEDAVEKLSFPTVMVLTKPYTEFTVTEVDMLADPITAKNIVHDYAKVLYAFTQGLVEYGNQHFPAAAGNLAEAIDGIDQSIHLHISDRGRSMLYFYLGESYYGLGKVEEGESWLNRAWDLNRSDPAIPLSLAIGYRGQGNEEELALNLDRAESLIADILTKSPNNVRGLYDKGLLNSLRDRHDLAAESYERAVEVDPAFYLAYVGLGLAYDKQEHYLDAERWLMAAQGVAEEQHISATRAWRALGNVYKKLGRTAEAEGAFHKAIELAPGLPWAYFDYAQFLDAQGEFDAALVNLRMVEATSADQSWANQELGDFFRKHKQYRAAVHYYQQAIDVSPTRALLRASLAESFFGLGDYQAAWQEFDKAVNLDPESAYIYADYGWHLNQANLSQGAAEKYEQALRLDPGSENTLQALTEIYHALKRRVPAARAACELVQPTRPYSPEAVKAAEQAIADLKINCTAGR